MMYYKGDALNDIKKFKIKEDDSLDIDSMPEFVKKPMMVAHFDEKVIKDKDGKDKTIRVLKEPTKEMGRDIGATVSLLTEGIKQLLDRVEALEKGK